MIDRIDKIGNRLGMTVQDVVIEHKTGNSDFNTLTNTWTTLETVKGVFRTMSGNERVASDGTTTFQNRRVYIDIPTNTITEKMRLNISGDIFNIVSINRLMDKKEFYQVDCVNKDNLNA